MQNEDIIEPFEEEAVKAALKKPPENIEELYLFPLTKRPYFPGMAAPMLIDKGPFYEALKTVARGEPKVLGLVMTKEEDLPLDEITYNKFHKVGVLAKILKIIPMEQGGVQVVLSMEKRIHLEKHIHDPIGIKAKISVHDDPPGTSEEMKAYSLSIIATIKDLLKVNPLFKEELQIFLGHSDFTEPGKLADFAVALTTASRDELQDVLDTFELDKRIDKAITLLKKELDLAKLQNNISTKIEATITKSQKEFFLKEQLKTIKKELGIEQDQKVNEREKFENRLKDKQIPDDVKLVINEELEKLVSLDAQSAEYAVTRGYLDWLTVLPWGILSKDNHNLKKAAKILEEDHWGLEDIKLSILEFISVGKLTGGVKGNIICLVGPPGVGKTSIGKSIARALGRKFFRFSVGGMRDEAEIKGHRRTYIGAMPGKMIQAMKYCQTSNPVIMLDEVDKMGSSFHGDPASALLEVLDPEQNKSFLDHYLDVRCDLSHVLFILTANVLDTIPEPLIDRMDVMRLSGYIMQEKLQIANKFLIPKNRKLMGLKSSQLSFTKEGIRAIINGYAREAGVRSLENNIKKIMRKIALEIVQDEERLKREKRKKKSKGKSTVPKKYVIGKDSLVKYLGKPIFTTDRFYEINPVGVCTGLAWTSLGGATLYIEAIKVAGEKTEMKLTGQAGQVMKESSEIAWSYLHSALNKYAPGYTFFEKGQVHIHIPEGATPKDGPSAGITMVTALLSLITNTPVLDNLGMTGEITLTGRILAVGGIKEKLVAARRSGLKTLIFPKDNARDIDELKEDVKKGLEIHLVTHYDEVFKIAFPDLSMETYDTLVTSL